MPNEGTSLIAVTPKPLYSPWKPSFLTICNAQSHVFRYFAVVVPDPTAVVEWDTSSGIVIVCILHLTRSDGTNTEHCTSPPKQPDNSKWPGCPTSPFCKFGSKKRNIKLSPAKEREFMKNWAKNGAGRPRYNPITPSLATVCLKYWNGDRWSPCSICMRVLITSRGYPKVIPILPANPPHQSSFATRIDKVPISSSSGCGKNDIYPVSCEVDCSLST